MNKFFSPTPGLVSIALLTMASAALGADLARPARNGGPESVAENPKVQPGKVRWHAGFAAACAAARTSGKPVLLFQMMGKLDEQFC